MQAIQFKRGSTFALAGLLTLPAGTWTAAADIRKSDHSLVAALDVVLQSITPDAQGHTHSIAISKAASETLGWDLGQRVCDIRFADQTSTVLYTQTFGVNVVLEITDV